MTEEWLPVVEWEGIYEVSNIGRVRRILALTNNRAGNVLKAGPDKNGYPRVFLSRDSRRCTRPVHRLVAEAFIGPRPDGLTINHKDGCKTHNAFTNLEYITNTENQRHARATGLMVSPKGEAAAAHKLTWLQVREIRTRYKPYDQNYGQYVLAKEYGVRETTVWNIIRGITWPDASYDPPKSIERDGMCLRGHSLEGDNLIIQSNGNRRCRACYRSGQNERRSRPDVRAKKVAYDKARRERGAST